MKIKIKKNNICCVKLNNYLAIIRNGFCISSS